MLLSSNPPPRRARSRSWGTDLHDIVSRSDSAPSLLSASLHISPHRHKVAIRSFRAVSSAAPLLPGHQHSSSLADVNEATVLKDEKIVHVPPPIPALSGTAPVKPADIPGAWQLHDTWQWYNDLPWLAGCNYLPRSAVNFIEMWDESTFDPKTIEEELKWAADKLGYNTLRTNLPMVLYEQDANGLTRRVNKFLRIAARCGFVVALVPLDDCEFSGRDPVAGPQPEPIPNLHNSQAVGSPGRKITMDESQWYRVEEYVRYVARTWGQDPRVFLLDLYNEPANPWVFTENGTVVIDDVEKYERCAYRLMEKCFEWAREEKPRQPLTVSAWHMPDPFFVGADSVVPLSHPIDKRAMELSDVISVHAYCNLQCLQTTLQEITHYGKPILLTEWMARQVQSTYETALPTLKELKVGAYQWGLVKGKTQTHLPWPHVAHQYQGDPMWWHDVLDEMGNFHNEEEGEVIRSFVYPQNKALSSDIFLTDVDSTESMDKLMTVSNSEELLNALDQHQVHLSMNKLATSASHLPEGLGSINELPSINESEHTVIPSVCSISMATINAAAAQHAGEMSVSSDLELRAASETGNMHAKSMPTFGNHLHSMSMEGLDLAEIGGIEF